LDGTARAGVAEAIAGNIARHVVYVVARNNPVASPTLDDATATPVLKGDDLDALCRVIARDRALKASVDGLTLTLPVPALAVPILRLIDGRRSVADIHLGLRDGGHPALTPERFAQAFRELYRVLNGVTQLLLRLP
jgi:hypothetical protein